MYCLLFGVYQVANIVNALYAPLNIFVILVGVKVWSQRDEIEVDLNAEKTLDNFLRYRMEVLARSMPNDNAQLITLVPRHVPFNLRVYADGVLFTTIIHYCFL